MKKIAAIFWLLAALTGTRAFAEPVLPQFGCEGSATAGPYVPAGGEEHWMAASTMSHAITNSIKISQTFFRLGIGTEGHLRYLGNWMAPGNPRDRDMAPVCEALYAVDPPVTVDIRAKFNRNQNPVCKSVFDHSPGPQVKAMPIGFLGLSLVKIDLPFWHEQQLEVAYYHADADFTRPWEDDYGACGNRLNYSADHDLPNDPAYWRDVEKDANGLPGRIPDGSK